MNFQRNNRETENNQVQISGTIVSVPAYSHEVFGEGFYTMDVTVERKSGTVDIIPITVSERLMDVTEDYTGIDIFVNGQFRSYNRHEGEKCRLILSVFAREVIFDLTGVRKNINEIVLRGHLCKKPMYRITPCGREIADMLLAVNRPYGKSDYIPCVCWGRNAVHALDLEIGTHLQIGGRIQSREYTKMYEDGSTEERVAYEVSISKMWEGYDEN